MGFITAEAALKSQYDVIVVGSGAGGGQTAYTLGDRPTRRHSRKDLQYIGNVPMASFAGPPVEVLKKVGLL